MSHPNKHIDDLHVRLNQARLVQQRNNRNTSSFSFPRFVASLRAALQGLRKKEQQDPRELECEFADAIPGFNEMLKKIQPKSVYHFGCGLFEIVLSGTETSSSDRTRQIVSIHGKVLLEGYNDISKACTENDAMYLCVKHTNDTDAVELIGYDRQADCFRTLIAADKGYDDFLVIPKENSITAYKNEPNREFRLDNLEPIEEPSQEHVVDEKLSSKRKIARRNRYYANYFGIAGKHMLKQNDSSQYALFAIDPVSQKHKRITGWHSKIFNSVRSGSRYIYAMDEHKDGARDILIYSLNGDLLHKKQYASSLGFDASSALQPLPLGLHSELNSTETVQEIGGKMIICNSRGRKIEGLEFNNIGKSGLGTTQCIRMPRQEGKIQFGLYSLEKQYRIIPPTMLSEIKFVSGIAVLNSPDGVRVVKAEDILECENKGIPYQ